MAQIRFYKPALYRKDMDAVLQTMVDEKIGPGERKKDFLRSFALYTGKKDGIALRSYIDAIVSSLKALEVSDGDSVMLSVLSPRVYLEALRRIGVKPILIDCSETGLPSADEAFAKLSEGPKALLLYEPICQIPESAEAYRDLGLPIIEDVSQSLGSFFDGGNKAGMTGDIVISEFEENGVVSTGGGAAAVSSDEAIIERLKKEASAASPYIDLPDMNAALGIVQISKIDTLLQRRNEIYKLFVQSQMKSGAKLFGSGSPSFFSNGYGFSVVVNSKPDDALAFAAKLGVSARHTFTQSIGARYQDRYDRFPNAIAPITRAISFPLYPFLSKSELEAIQRTISHLE